LFRTMLQDHTLVKTVLEQQRVFIKEAWEYGDGKPRQLRPATETEVLTWDLARAIGEILWACRQLHFARDLLSGYRKATAPEGMSRYDHIVYGIENYHIRSTMIYDRCLKLTNVVFGLGLPPRECRATTVTQNENVRGTRVASALKAIDKVTSNHRENRHRIIHSETYHEKDLEPIGTFYLIDPEEDDEVWTFRHYAKTLADRLVSDKQIEFAQSTADLENKVAVLLDSLAPYAYRRLGIDKVE
jgi:hypothetical protein